MRCYYCLFIQHIKSKRINSTEKTYLDAGLSVCQTLTLRPLSVIKRKLKIDYGKIWYYFIFWNTLKKVTKNYFNFNSPIFKNKNKTITYLLENIL